MPASAKTAALAALSEKIRHLERVAPSVGPRRASAFSFGIESLDQTLSDVRFPFASLHEVLGQTGPADFTASRGFVAALAGHLKGGVLWCVGRNEIYGHGIASVGLSPDHVVFAEANGDEAILSAMEEGLRHASLAAVVGEVRRVSLIASRRLLLAAEKSGVAAFLLRPPISKKRAEHIACATRWRVSVQPSEPLPVKGVGPPRWSLELLRCRGGKTGQWIIEAPDASGHFRISAAVAGGTETKKAAPHWFRAPG